MGVAVLLAAGCATVPASVPDPLSAEERNDLGVAHFARGDYARAVAELERALALRPRFHLALVNLGDARLGQGDVEGAIAAYEAAMRARPGDPPTANNLAWALLQHPRRWPEAEALVRAALARDPGPRGYYLDTLGLVLLRKGRPREALSAFREALGDRSLRDPRTRALALRHARDALRELGDAAGADRCDDLAREVETGAGGNSVGEAETLC